MDLMTVMDVSLGCIFSKEDAGNNVLLVPTETPLQISASNVQLFVTNATVHLIAIHANLHIICTKVYVMRAAHL
jgi:hypothetical protein